MIKKNSDPNFDAVRLEVILDHLRSLEKEKKRHQESKNLCKELQDQSISAEQDGKMFEINEKIFFFDLLLQTEMDKKATKKEE